MLDWEPYSGQAEGRDQDPHSTCNGVPICHLVCLTGCYAGGFPGHAVSSCCLQEVAAPLPPPTPPPATLTSVSGSPAAAVT